LLADQFTGAAAAARNTAALDNLSRLIWRANAEGHLDDAAAGAAGEAVQRRRRDLAMSAYPKARTAAGAQRREPRSPDRRASLERRRRQAMSGVVPAKIAAHFTMAELAVLTVVARQCQRAGTCSLHIDAIAALAGVCRTTVKRAFRQARLRGLLLVKERRIPGRKSLTNIIRIVSEEWLGWLRLTIGGQKMPTPVNSAYKPEPLRPSLRAERGIRGEQAQGSGQSGVKAKGQTGEYSPAPTIGSTP
jgi:hypothetical protein